MSPTCEDLARVVADPPTDAAAAEAFAKLRDRYEHRVLAFVATRLFRRHEAEDVAQDVWITVWTKLPTHYQEGAVLSWVFQIASNRCIDQNRKKRPDLFPEGEAPESTPWDESDPTLLSVVQREKVGRLKSCIDQLDARHRCVVISTLRGHKTAAVAERCGVTANQVSKAKASATRTLHQCVEGVAG